MIIHRIKQSLEAHYQNWQARHYNITSAGKQILKYKNCHLGERCFVIGNGPSLRAEDLEMLHENNVATFATNRIFNIFSDTNWRPTYYACEDILILRDIQKIIPDVPSRARFIPVNLKWYEGVDVKNASYFFMDYNSPFDGSHGLSLDPTKAIRCRGTVTISCLQLAIYMGFKDIYLLGVDHCYSKYKDEHGNIIESPDVKDYFSDNYDTDFKNQIMRDLGSTTRAFGDAEKLSRQMGNFRIYNATRGGRLEVFERVDFDHIFTNNGRN